MIASYWSELLAVGLLGTDRRPPPQVPSGPLADLAADLAEPTPPAHLLHQLGAATVLQRAAFTPLPPTVRSPQFASDDRPPTPPTAETTFRRIVHQWPVLLHEWLHRVVDNGWRLGPELVVPAFLATRSNPPLSALVRSATGPSAEWMIELWPSLVPRRRAPAAAPYELPLTAELGALLTAQPEQAAAELFEALVSARLGSSHRAVLVNFIATVPVASLAPIARALNADYPTRPIARLAGDLADLAELRHLAIAELERL